MSAPAPNSAEPNPTLEKINYFRRYKKDEITLDELADKVYEIDKPKHSKLLSRILFFLSLIFAFFIPRENH